MKLGEPLRFATIPEDYESLVGIAARATADHVLLDLNRVLRRAGISMDRPGYLPRLDLGILAGLASVLGCTVEEVVSRATTLLDPDAKSGPVTMGALVLHAQDIEIERRRISPLAVAAGSYHREAWLVRLLPFCPVSYELLRSDCSDCGAGLGWKKSVGIGICETCEQTIAPAVAPLLADEYREDYTLFSRLLSSRCAVRDKAVAELSAEVRQLDGESLLRLVIGLGACVHVERRFVERKTVHKLPPATLAAIVSTGTRMLRTWPDGLQAWARQEAGKLVPGGAAFQRLRATLQRLGARAFVSEEQATLVRTALPDLFCNVQRSFKPLSDTLLRQEAGALLGVSDRLIPLVDAGHLKAEELTAGKQRRVRFSRSAVEDLRRRLDGSLSFPMLARATGLPVYAIESLCNHGDLDREMDPALYFLRHTISVTSESINRLREPIFARKGLRHPADAVPLGTAARRIGGGLKPWRNILLALADHSMNCWIDAGARPDKPWLRSIFVRPSDLARFDGFETKMPRRGEDATPEDCSIGDAREILNLDGTTTIDLQKVLSSELAARNQRGRRKSVAMKAVLEIAQAEISVAEICARANWNARQAKWALRRFEDARTPCGWDRSVIENSGVLLDTINWNVRAHRRHPGSGSKKSA